MSPRSPFAFASLLVGFVACTTNPEDPAGPFDQGTGSGFGGAGGTTGSLQPTSGSTSSTTSSSTTTSTTSTTSTGMGGAGGTGGAGGAMGTGGFTPGAATVLYPSCACVIDQAGPGFCATCVDAILMDPGGNAQCGPLVTACVGTCRTILDQVLLCSDLATGEQCLDMAASLDLNPSVLDDVKDVLTCLCTNCSSCDSGTCQ